MKRLNAFFAAVLFLVLPSLAWSYEDIRYDNLHVVAGATGAGKEIVVERFDTVGLQVVNTGTAILTPEVSIDGLNWVNAACSVTPITSSGIYTCKTTGVMWFRARISSFTSGTVTVTSLSTTGEVGSASSGAFASTTLYPYRSTISVQDDFLSGGASSGNVGILGWTSVGTISFQNSITNRIGIVRLDTGAVSGTAARVSGPSSTLYDFSLSVQMIWIDRLNTNDANTQVRIGAANAVSAATPNDGIYFEKLDGDTNWFCVTRAASTQTRTDSTVAVSTNFDTFMVTRNSSGVQFNINNTNVCGLITTNIPTVFISPFTNIINSAAAAKTLDIDYFQLMISGISR